MTFELERNLNEVGKFDTLAWVERVIIYGYKTQPKSVKIEYKNQSTQLQFNYDSANKVLLIRKPAVNINLDWSIIIN